MAESDGIMRLSWLLTPPEASDIAPEGLNRTREAMKGLGDFNRAIQARWKGIVVGGGGSVGDGQGGFM